MPGLSVLRHPRSDSEATSNCVPSEESVPLYLKRVFFGTILPAKASVPFICAIRKIRGSISLRSEQPLAVTQAVWSAAGGRACTGCLSSGNAETHFVKKRVRCSRGCLPASGGPPSDRRKLLPPITPHPLSFPALRRPGEAGSPSLSHRDVASTLLRSPRSLAARSMVERIELGRIPAAHPSRKRLFNLRGSNPGCTEPPPNRYPVPSSLSPLVPRPSALSRPRGSWR